MLPIDVVKIFIQNKYLELFYTLLRKQFLMDILKKMVNNVKFFEFYGIIVLAIVTRSFSRI